MKRKKRGRLRRSEVEEDDGEVKQEKEWMNLLLDSIVFKRFSSCGV